MRAAGYCAVRLDIRRSPAIYNTLAALNPMNDRIEAFERLLRELPTTPGENEVDFTRLVVPQLAKILGYSEAETFYEYRAGEANRRADVVFTQAIGNRPWLVLEIKRGRARNIGDWVYQVRGYMSALDCPIGVVISPSLVILVTADNVERFEISSITREEADKIFAALDRHDLQSTDGLRDERNHLIEMIESVEGAVTNESKGKSLERLASWLCDGTPSLRSKYRNLITRSSEIDIVVEYDDSAGRIALFHELGRYCLVECKNWSKPVGVSPVRDFMGKLDKCKVRLGLIFSKNGVTGVDSGADALREIQSRFDRDGVYVLVFSLEDLKTVADSAGFVRLLDEKADALRFDAEGG